MQQRIRSNSLQKQEDGFKKTQKQLYLLDQFLNPSAQRKSSLQSVVSMQRSTKSSKFELQPPLNKSFQLPSVKDINTENEEIKEAEQMIEYQNKQLKKLLKEQKEVQIEVNMKREIETLRQQMNFVTTKLPKLPQFSQFEDLKSEIRSLRNSFQFSVLQQQTQQQQPQIQYIYQPPPPPPPYYYYNPPYQQYPPPQQYYQPPYQQQQYPNYNPYQQQQQQQQQQQYDNNQYSNQQQFQQQQNYQQRQSTKQSFRRQTQQTFQSQESQNSRRSSIASNSQSKREFKQLSKRLKGMSLKPIEKNIHNRLRTILLTVLAAMRWKIYCKPQNKLWRKLYQHLSDCKAQIQKITQPIVLQRINNWTLIVLAKVQNYIQNIKELDFINQQLSQANLDQAFTQLTTAMKFLLSSLITYSTADFVIPELKLLCYVQFFEQLEIDRGLFVARRVFFWKEHQLDMTKTQQMMIISELVLLVHIIPTLLGLKGSIFLLKCLASLIQIYFMKYFELRILNRYPEYHLVYIEVELKEDKFYIQLKEIEKIEEEKYIIGLYEEKDFQEFYNKRPKFEEEMMKGIQQISENLLYSLMSQ